MIKKLTIAGYQSHKETSFEFHEGVNAITGTSDSGKSSVIRALKWLIENQPRGHGFLSWYDGVDGTTVTAELSTGENITRTRTKSLNQYQINNDEPLKSLRTGVPDEITSVLRMDELNIQEQHKPYFLLQDGPSLTATKFNEIARLEVMDMCTKEAKSFVRMFKNQSEGLSKEIDKTQEALADLAWLKDAEEDIVELERLELEIQTLEHKLEDARELCSEHEELTLEIGDTDNIASLEDDVQRALSLSYNIYSVHEKVERAKALHNDHNTLIADIEELSSVDVFGSDIDEALAAIRQINHKTSNIKTARELLQSAESINVSITSIDAEIARLDKQFKKELGAHGLCPLCDAQIHIN